MNRSSRLTLFLLLVALGGCEGALVAKLCVFSDVEGVVRVGGQPVADALVVRSWSWVSGEPRTDSVRTDAQGRFTFPAIYERSLLRSILPVEAVVKQRILIRRAAQEHVGYDFVKRNYEPNGEFGRPLRLSCDLGGSLDGEHFYGVCVLEP